MNSRAQPRDVGGLRMDEVLSREIVRRILGVARPDRIIVFGSAATGKTTRDSDVDLLVLEARPGELREEAGRIRSALRGLGLAFDVVVMSSERFEETKQVIGGIAYPAWKYGRVVYEAA